MLFYSMRLINKIVCPFLMSMQIMFDSPKFAKLTNNIRQCDASISFHQPPAVFSSQSLKRDSTKKTPLGGQFLSQTLSSNTISLLLNVASKKFVTFRVEKVNHQIKSHHLSFDTLSNQFSFSSKTKIYQFQSVSHNWWIVILQVEFTDFFRTQNLIQNIHVNFKRTKNGRHYQP